MLSAIAIALVVVLVALIARELGAGRAGQAVAALSTAASGIAMAVGHLLSTTTFDLLVCVAFLVLLVVRILARRRRSAMAAGRPCRRRRPGKQASRAPPARRAHLRLSRLLGASIWRAAPGYGEERRWPSSSGCRTSSGRRTTVGRNSARRRDRREIRPATGAALPLQLLLMVRSSQPSGSQGSGGFCAAPRPDRFARSGSRI